jgi:hypothetical protein
MYIAGRAIYIAGREIKNILFVWQIMYKGTAHRYG